MQLHRDKCDSYRRTSEKKGRGLINALINRLPIELHIPGYQFCGPGTRLSKRLARGDKGINPLDEACKAHDINYAKSNKLEDRHKADKLLGDKAWERFHSKDATFGEKAAALTISGIMKGKTKLGMGVRSKRKRSKKFKGVIKKVLSGIMKGKTKIGMGVRSKRKRSKKFKGVIKKVHKRVGGKLQSKSKKKKKTSKKRIIPIPKTGGILPLIPIFAALGALGSLAGGGAAVAKAVSDSKVASKTLQETERHNKAMEAVGKGLYLKPYKKGRGLYMTPYQKNFR
jgi:hypothetical protein